MKKIIILTTLVTCTFLVSFILRFNTYDKNATDAVLTANASPIEVLFEHQMNEGNILLYRSPEGDELSLAFLSRNFSGFQYVESSTQYDISDLETQAGITYVVLPKSSEVPFTIYAGVTGNPDLAEVFVMEPGFQIAHSASLMESSADGDDLYVWIAASPDFTGTNFSIMGLNTDGQIIGDIEHDGAQLTIHSIDTAQAQ